MSTALQDRKIAQVNTEQPAPSTLAAWEKAIGDPHTF